MCDEEQTWPERAQVFLVRSRSATGNPLRHPGREVHRLDAEHRATYVPRLFEGAGSKTRCMPLGYNTAGESA
jgi:hypothetical protein